MPTSNMHTYSSIIANLKSTREELERAVLSHRVQGRRERGGVGGYNTPPPIILSSKSWSELGNFS